MRVYLRVWLRYLVSSFFSINAKAEQCSNLWDCKCPASTAAVIKPTSHAITHIKSLPRHLLYSHTALLNQTKISYFLRSADLSLPQNHCSQNDSEQIWSILLNIQKVSFKQKNRRQCKWLFLAPELFYIYSFISILKKSWSLMKCYQKIYSTGKSALWILATWALQQVRQATHSTNHTSLRVRSVHTIMFLWFQRGA